MRSPVGYSRLSASSGEDVLAAGHGRCRCCGPRAARRWPPGAPARREPRTLGEQLGGDGRRVVGGVVVDDDQLDVAVDAAGRGDDRVDRRRRGSCPGRTAGRRRTPRASASSPRRCRLDRRAGRDRRGRQAQRSLQCRGCARPGRGTPLQRPGQHAQLLGLGCAGGDGRSATRRSAGRAPERVLDLRQHGRCSARMPGPGHRRGLGQRGVAAGRPGRAGRAAL